MYHFQGSCDFTQEKPLSPRIFNIFFNTIVQHWAGLMVDNKVKPEGFGHDMTEKSTLFYAENGLVASINMVWL